MPAAGNEWGSFTLAPGDVAISFLRLSAANWKGGREAEPLGFQLQYREGVDGPETGSHWVGCPSRRNVSFLVSEETLDQVSICSLH